MLTLDFWEGGDDDRALQLTEDGTNLSEARYGALTKVELLVRAASGTVTTLSTQDAEPALAVDSAGQRITLELGESGLAAGLYRARLVVYSADQPNGVTFGDYSDHGDVTGLEIRIYP